jgi:glycosyltransferase involved in cell wall biosynthesis
MVIYQHSKQPMPKISILVPTRGRPRRLLDFLQSIIDTTAVNADVEVVLGIDEDDHSYEGVELPEDRLQIKKTVAPQASMGSINTRCLQHATGELIMLGNDDVIFRTRGWDQIVLTASQRYPDGIFLMYARDGIKNDAFPCFPILSKSFCTLIGDPFPALYQGDGIDMHLYDIFVRLKDRGLSRFCYLDNVYMEHRHISNGKGNFDAIYSVRSHKLGNYHFYSLWEQREQNIRAILGEMARLSPSAASSSLILIWKCFLHSRQSSAYRWKYLLYHTAREVYFYFQLHKLKRFIIRMYSQLKFREVPS